MSNMTVEQEEKLLELLVARRTMREACKMAALAIGEFVALEPRTHFAAKQERSLAAWDGLEQVRRRLAMLGGDHD